MSKQNKQQTTTTSMETLWKVLLFIGKYRFLLVLSIILAALSVHPAVICTGTFR